MGNEQAQPGWYDDGSGRQRWWDGSTWTDQYAPTAPVPGFYPDPSGQERWWDGVRWAAEPRYPAPVKPPKSSGKEILQAIGAGIGLLAILALGFGVFSASQSVDPNERYEDACVEVIAERVGVAESAVNVINAETTEPDVYEVRGVLTEEYSFMCRADKVGERFTQILLIDSTGENVW